MRLPWRSRFHDVIERQLALFEADQRPLLVRIAEAKSEYEHAPRGEAEERFGDYMDLVEEAEDELLALRDRYGATMAEAERQRYERDFLRAAQRRLPSLGARRLYERALETDEE
jgi:hypothetical protein